MECWNPHIQSAVVTGCDRRFFYDRKATDTDLHRELKALLSAYQKAQEFRNNIAHGMVMQFALGDRTLSGYFLCPPVYATKKVVKAKPSGVWLLDAAYWYKAEDITYYADRFIGILAETMVQEDAEGERLYLVTHRKRSFSRGILRLCSRNSCASSFYGFLSDFLR